MYKPYKLRLITRLRAFRKWLRLFVWWDHQLHKWKNQTSLIQVGPMVHGRIQLKMKNTLEHNLSSPILLFFCLGKVQHYIQIEKKTWNQNCFFQIENYHLILQRLCKVPWEASVLYQYVQPGRKGGRIRKPTFSSTTLNNTAVKLLKHNKHLVNKIFQKG